MSNTIYIDGDFTEAAACSPRRPYAPIQGDAAEYAFEQDYIQFAANRVALAIGTQHPTLTDFYLAGESQPDHIGNGVVRWRRTYAMKPPSHSQPVSMGYTFPGIAPFSGEAARNPVTRQVLARVQHDYFRIAASGGDYTSEMSIPRSPAFKVYDSSGEPYESAQVGGFTTPEAADYIDWIENAETLGWSSGIAPGGTNPGQLVAADATIERWLGSIWVRKTIYVLAQ